MFPLARYVCQCDAGREHGVAGLDATERGLARPQQVLAHVGTITFAMFEEKISTQEVRTYFETMGLNIWDAWSFFKLLDTDGGGMVEAAKRGETVSPTGKKTNRTTTPLAEESHQTLGQNLLTGSRMDDVLADPYTPMEK